MKIVMKMTLRTRNQGAGEKKFFRESLPKPFNR